MWDAFIYLQVFYNSVDFKNNKIFWNFWNYFPPFGKTNDLKCSDFINNNTKINLWNSLLGGRKLRQDHLNGLELIT